MGYNINRTDYPSGFSHNILACGAFSFINFVCGAFSYISFACGTFCFIKKGILFQCLIQV